MDDPKPPAASAVQPRPHDEFFELSDLEKEDLTMLNGKTLAGLTVDDNDDHGDDDDGGGRAAGSVNSFMSYFITGAGATFLILLALASLFGIAGGVGHAMGLKKPMLTEELSAWTFCVAVAILLTALGILRIFINMFFRILGLIASWNWLHHAKEMEAHLTASLFLTASLALSLRFLSDPDLPVKLILALLFMVVCLAAKSNYMRSLAMSFNYENYRDRIEMALETDRLLGCLWKARHTYKFRKRVNVSGRISSGGFWRGTATMGAGAGRSGDVSPKNTIHAGETVIGPFTRVSRSGISPGTSSASPPETTPPLSSSAPTSPTSPTAPQAALVILTL